MTDRRKIISRLKGILIPVVTPMDSRGRILYRSFQENLRKWQHYPFAGFVVAGSTGEMPYLQSAERLRLFEAARQIVKPPQLLVGVTGVESTQQTLQLSRAAERVGVDCLLVLTPNYFQSKMTSGALQTYFETIAEGVLSPVAIYSIPQFTGIKMDPKAIGELSNHPNIVAIKESSGDTSFVRAILRRVMPGFRVLLGSPSLMLRGLQWGATGGILGVANYAPELCLELIEAFRKNHRNRMQHLQRQMTYLQNKVNIPFGVAGIKAATELLGFSGGPPRSPLLPLTRKERAVLEILIKPFLGSRT